MQTLDLPLSVCTEFYWIECLTLRGLHSNKWNESWTWIEIKVHMRGFIWKHLWVKTYSKLKLIYKKLKLKININNKKHTNLILTLKTIFNINQWWTCYRIFGLNFFRYHLKTLSTSYWKIQMLLEIARVHCLLFFRLSYSALRDCIMCTYIQNSLFCSLVNYQIRTCIRLQTTPKYNQYRKQPCRNYNCRKANKEIIKKVFCKHFPFIWRDSFLKTF